MKCQCVGCWSCLQDILKHAMATHVLDTGADLAFVKDWLGHATIQHTTISARLTTATLDAQAQMSCARHRTAEKMPVTPTSSRGIELAQIHWRALFRSSQATEHCVESTGVSHKENIVQEGGDCMQTKWMRRWGLGALLLVLTPLLAVGQPRAREALPDRSADRSRGEVQVANDWRDEITLSMRTDNQERLGEWSIRPGENVVLQERGERIRIRPNYKITVGDSGDWVDVGQVGQFRNGTWYVNVREVVAAAYQNHPAGRDARRGQAQPRDASPKGEESPLDQILKRIK